MYAERREKNDLPSRGVSSCIRAGCRAADGTRLTIFLRARPQDSSATLGVEIPSVNSKVDLSSSIPRKQQVSAYGLLPRIPPQVSGNWLNGEKLDAGEGSMGLVWAMFSFLGRPGRENDAGKASSQADVSTYIFLA